MAANYFEAFGNQFKGYISTFSTDTSAALIDNLGSVVAVGLVMFIIVRSFMMMRENNYGAIYDIIVQMLKIGFIAFLALNTGHFTSYVVKALEYFQSGLIEAVSHGLHSTVQITSAWGALDQLWETFTNAFDAVSGLIGKFSWITDAPEILAMCIVTVALGMLSVYFTFSALGILLINEVSLIIFLGFGPLFLCTLMFPRTQSWFDGWIRSVITTIFTLVITSAVIMLFVQAFQGSVDEISREISGSHKRTRQFVSPGDEFCRALFSCGHFSQAHPRDFGRTHRRRKNGCTGHRSDASRSRKRGCRHNRSPSVGFRQRLRQFRDCECRTFLAGRSRSKSKRRTAFSRNGVGRRRRNGRCRICCQCNEKCRQFQPKARLRLFFGRRQCLQKNIWKKGLRMNSLFIKYLIAACCTSLLCACGAPAPALPHGARVPINAPIQSKSTETNLVFGEENNPVTSGNNESVQSGSH